MKGIGQSNKNDQCDKATRIHSNIEKYKEFSDTDAWIYTEARGASLAPDHEIRTRNRFLR
jgi:hypothetical protein